MKDYKTQGKLGRLRPSDITSSVCNSCIKSGPPHCCQILLGVDHSPMSLELAKRGSEVYEDHLRVSEHGEIILTCSQLDEENGVCTIYEDRPQICRDYNCVSWTQVDFSRGAPKKNALNYNKIEKMLKGKTQGRHEEL